MSEFTKWLLEISHIAEFTQNWTPGQWTGYTWWGVFFFYFLYTVFFKEPRDPKGPSNSGSNGGGSNRGGGGKEEIDRERARRTKIIVNDRTEFDEDGHRYRKCGCHCPSCGKKCTGYQSQSDGEEID